MASIIKIITNDESRSNTRQSNQHESLNAKRSGMKSVSDSLNEERSNIDNQPLKLADRTNANMGRDIGTPPLDGMTGKKGMGFKQAASGVGLIALGSLAVNEVANNVGLFYNDQSKQNAVSNVREGIAIGGKLVGAVTVGAVIGGPVGAGIGLAIGLATEAIGLASGAVSLSRELTNKFNQSERDANRLGQIVSVKR